MTVPLHFHSYANVWRPLQTRHVLFADARERHVPLDFAAAHVAQVQDWHFRRYSMRLKSAVADEDGALCARLGVRSPVLDAVAHVAPRSTRSSSCRCDAPCCLVLGLIAALDERDWALEVEFTDLELRLFWRRRARYRSTQEGAFK